MLEIFLFCLEYLFSWVVKQDTTLKQLWLFSWLNFFIPMSSVFVVVSTLLYHVQCYPFLIWSITLQQVAFNVPDMECVNTSQWGFSSVLNIGQFLVVLRSNETNLEYIFVMIASTFQLQLTGFDICKYQYW